ncbi:MAG: aminotransferase class III-fold pyridoxal phosphate-dependent enzyme [Rhizobiales bacterium]|nr:aminotransferase class III-fold pyridoxal phosphate-dependent enzyme [Hyphomicrobiales bacterium]NRB14366.1 aminotransferase class III-fold pyridoxal phosphate-dependent enzyme [Hyphomicrobiales bacterium]
MTTDKYSKLVETNKNTIFHPASSISDVLNNGTTIFTTGNGARITTHNEGEFIDGMAGLWCMNIGYGRQEIGETMLNAATNLGYAQTFAATSNQPQIELSEKLLQLTKGVFSRVHYGLSGSDCNDTAFKLIRLYNNLRGKPNKKHMMARVNAYHGTTVAAASLTGIPSFHTAFDLPIDGILRAPKPHFYADGLAGETEPQFTQRMMDEIEKIIIDAGGADYVAAFFAEPIYGAGGVITPPQGYFVALRKLCDRYDILLVADEVITGFGRTGEWFAHQYYGFKPDLMTTAKGLTSGYFPLSALFIGPKVWDVMVQEADQLAAFFHGFTYGGHPTGCAVALKNLEIIERENLVERAKTMGDYLHRELRNRLQGSQIIGEIRGAGLLAGLQLVKSQDLKQFFAKSDKAAVKLQAAVRKHKVLLRGLPTADALAISPSFVIKQSEIDSLVSAVVAGVEEIENILL